MCACGCIDKRFFCRYNRRQNNKFTKDDEVKEGCCHEGRQENLFNFRSFGFTINFRWLFIFKFQKITFLNP